MLSDENKENDCLHKFGQGFKFLNLQIGCTKQILKNINNLLTFSFLNSKLSATYQCYLLKIW